MHFVNSLITQFDYSKPGTHMHWLLSVDPNFRVLCPWEQGKHAVEWKFGWYVPIWHKEQPVIVLFLKLPGGQGRQAKFLSQYSRTNSYEWSLDNVELLIDSNISGRFLE